MALEDEFVLEVEAEGVVEGHVVAISAEDNDHLSEENSAVAVPCGRTAILYSAVAHRLVCEVTRIH